MAFSWSREVNKVNKNHSNSYHTLTRNSGAAGYYNGYISHRVKVIGKDEQGRAIFHLISKNFPKYNRAEDLLKLPRRGWGKESLSLHSFIEESFSTLEEGSEITSVPMVLPFDHLKITPPEKNLSNEIQLAIEKMLREKYFKENDFKKEEDYYIGNIEVFDPVKGEHIFIEVNIPVEYDQYKPKFIKDSNDNIITNTNNEPNQNNDQL